MIQIEHLLYPRSKAEVLKTLYLANSPVPLRELAYRSNLVLGSVQSALASLLKDRVVKREKRGNRTYFELISPEAKALVAEIIKLSEITDLKERALLLNKRSQRILPEIEERVAIINHARKSLTK